jgi:high-affinity iron transporter
MIFTFLDIRRHRHWLTVAAFACTVWSVAPGARAERIQGHADDLRTAVDAYDPATPEPGRRGVADAFFAFEGSQLDRDLAIREPALYREIEDEWLRLLADLGAGKSIAEVRSRAGRVEALLDRGVESAAAGGSVYLDSLLIILREGFEAILIVSALAAYLTRVGETSRLPYLYGGAGMAVAASFSLWFAARTMIELSGVGQEALEGATMLLATLVLFWVSYWLVSKAEAERWQAFVKSRAEAAIGRGALLGFGVLSFVVVFREGFETVLFYEALAARSSGPTGHSVLVGGFLTGCGLLAVVYALFLRLGRKIPMREFFGVTGALLYFMAFKFAGGGIYELQATGRVPQTLVGWFPDRAWLRQWLGVYPYTEPLALQAVLVLLVALAAAAAWRSRRGQPSRETEHVSPMRAAGG